MTTGSSPIPETVKEMVDLEAREQVKMSPSDRIADRVSAFAGSTLFVWLHLAWFAVWIFCNSVLGLTFDSFPYGLLTMIVSLEAIFLSTFVLISQNRQALLADRRSKIDLQVNMIAELEVTKLIALISEIHESLGLSRGDDHEVRQFREPMHVTHIADAVDAAEKDQGADQAAGPKSAVDTEV